MVTFDWTITAGNVMELTSLGGGGLWFLYRVCRRFDRVDQRVTTLTETQAERSKVQDQRHEENVRRLERIEGNLMDRRPGR